jgi:hypothetical protein
LQIKKTILIIVLGLLLSANANSESKAIKLVCNDTKDPSLPLSIEIHNYGSVRLAQIGDYLVDLQVSEVMYTLTLKDDKVDIFGTILRNDGTFKLNLKIGAGEPFNYRGFCKKNKPLF